MQPTTTILYGLAYDDGISNLIVIVYILVVHIGTTVKEILVV